MNYQQFETWINRLSEADKKYLGKHPTWKKDHEKVKQNHALIKGFVENTMEILEGGSESET